jgi:cytochrome b
VIAPLAYAVAALALVSMCWGLLTAVLDKAPGKAQLLYAAGLEVVVLVQSVLALVALVRGFRPAELATTIGYLIGILVLMPVAWVWANSERTRFSGVVLAVAAAAVAAMTFRLVVLWVPA